MGILLQDNLFRAHLYSRVDNFFIFSVSEPFVSVPQPFLKMVFSFW